MLLSSPAELGVGRAKPFDVCVVGSGPAGITLAHTLGQAGMSVVLLEAGAATYSDKSQSVYDGDFYGAPPLLPLRLSRLRQYGGSSNHWGGWCRALEGADFAAKAGDPESAWPISRVDIDPYLARAAEILELPEFPADETLDDNLRRVSFVYSPPVNFALKFGDSLARSQQITVALNSYVTGFDVEAGRVLHARVLDIERREHLVAARRFIVCTGGIENSRLLLWANARSNGRVVPEPAALGRYWMEHPHFTLGTILLESDFPFGFDQKNTVYFAPTPAAIGREAIRDFALRVHPAKKGVTRKLITDLACVAPALGEKVFQRFHKRLVCGLLLRAQWEQPPRAYNRVVLSDRVDAFGVARADLHWYLEDADRRTPKAAADMLAHYLTSRGIGRLRLDPWVWGQEDFPIDDETGGNHHMGGTRMSTDPRHGIVDADCRVHGVGNLYVGGSSVFPSAGFANPTLTIVQLALRLAEHLRTSLRRDGAQHGQLRVDPLERA